MRALQFLENAQPALYRGANLEPDTAGERPAQRRARLQHAARAIDLELDEGAPSVVAAPLGDVLLGHALALHFVLRQVDAAPGVIDRHVLPEIHELQRGTDRV